LASKSFGSLVRARGRGSVSLRLLLSTAVITWPSSSYAQSASSILPPTREEVTREQQNQPQVRPQHRLGVERQRQPQVAVEVAFVGFVEQHGRNAGQFGIRLNSPQENAFGKDEDPGSRRAPAVQARGIADCLADLFGRELCHSFGRGACRKTARRQKQDLAVAPGLAEQGRRHRRCLACAGRRNQNRVRAIAQRGLQIRQYQMDGKPGHACPPAPASISAGDRELHRLDQGGLGATGGERS